MIGVRQVKDRITVYFYVRSDEAYWNVLESSFEILTILLHV